MRIFFFFFFFLMRTLRTKITKTFSFELPGIKPRSLHVLGKCFIPELHPYPTVHVLVRIWGLGVVLHSYNFCTQAEARGSSRVGGQSGLLSEFKANLNSVTRPVSNSLPLKKKKLELLQFICSVKLLSNFLF